MKQILAIIFIGISGLMCKGQTAVIGIKPKTVTEGKKWILSCDKEILIEVSSGTLNSGTLCNARITSIPHIIIGVFEGEYGAPHEVYTILCKNINKVPYLNNTYSVLPISIVNSGFNLDELKYKSLDSVGIKQIVFYPWEKVYVGECIKSIQLTESELSRSEMEESKKMMDNKKAEEERRRKNQEIETQKFFSDWQSQIIQEHIQDSIKENTFPRIYLEQSIPNPNLYSYIIQKRKNGKLIIRQINAYLQCDECMEKIAQLMSNLNKGLYKVSFRITNVTWEISRGLFKKEIEVELFGTVEPYIDNFRTLY